MTPETNIFNLPRPDQYRCHVHRYYSGLSRLYIRVYRAGKPAFYLLFTDTGYYEGALSWEGADFGIAPHADCVKLMLSAGLIGEAILQFPDAYAAITENARLYVVVGTSVRFIAGSATLLLDIPAELK